jgi:hypothetical protein
MLAPPVPLAPPAPEVLGPDDPDVLGPDPDVLVASDVVPLVPATVVDGPVVALGEPLPVDVPVDVAPCCGPLSVESAPQPADKTSAQRGALHRWIRKRRRYT